MIITTWVPAASQPEKPFYDPHSKIQRWANEVQYLCSEMLDEPTDMELQWLLALNSAAAMIKNLMNPLEQDYWISTILMWCDHAKTAVRGDRRNPRILSQDERTFRVYALELVALAEPLKSVWPMSEEFEELGREDN